MKKSLLLSFIFGASIALVVALPCSISHVYAYKDIEEDSGSKSGGLPTKKRQRTTKVWIGMPAKKSKKVEDTLEDSEADSEAQLACPPAEPTFDFNNLQLPGPFEVGDGSLTAEDYELLRSSLRRYGDSLLNIDGKKE